jgi:hypothetical protein
MREVAVGAGMAAFPQAPPWAECPVSAHGGSEPDWLKRPIAAVTGCRRLMLAGPEPSSRSACQAVHSPPVTNPPHPIRVNRATVLTLWASVVAELCSAHRFLRYATLPSVRSSRRRGPGLGGWRGEEEELRQCRIRIQHSVTGERERRGCQPQQHPQKHPRGHWARYARIVARDHVNPISGCFQVRVKSAFASGLNSAR